MNKKIIFGIIVLVVISLGVVVYSSSNSSKQDDSMKGDKVAGKFVNEVVSTDKAGSYESYDSSKIALADTHNVVLFFRAGWCPSCIAIDKDIKANLGSIPENLIILDVDYDKSTELKKKYKVTYQHTFVKVDAQGELVKKWSGSPTLASLITEVK